MIDKNSLTEILIKYIVPICTALKLSVSKNAEYGFFIHKKNISPIFSGKKTMIPIAPVRISDENRPIGMFHTHPVGWNKRKTKWYIKNSVPSLDDILIAILNGYKYSLIGQLVSKKEKGKATVRVIDINAILECAELTYSNLHKKSKVHTQNSVLQKIIKNILNSKNELNKYSVLKVINIEEKK